MDSGRSVRPVDLLGLDRRRLDLRGDGRRRLQEGRRRNLRAGDAFVERSPPERARRRRVDSLCRRARRRAEVGRHVVGASLAGAGVRDRRDDRQRDARRRPRLRNRGTIRRKRLDDDGGRARPRRGARHVRHLQRDPLLWDDEGGLLVERLELGEGRVVPRSRRPFPALGQR